MRIVCILLLSIFISLDTYASIDNLTSATQALIKSKNRVNKNSSDKNIKSMKNDIRYLKREIKIFQQEYLTSASTELRECEQLYFKISEEE